MKLSIAPLTILGVTYASVVAGLTMQRRAVDFFDPTQGGGSIFDNATFGGEPLNVSTSAYSHLTRSPSLPVMVTGDLIFSTRSLYRDSALQKSLQTTEL